MNNKLVVRRWLAVLFLATVFIAIFVLGCGSGSVIKPPSPPVKTPPVVTPPPVAPPPSYPLQVSATALSFTNTQGQSPADQQVQIGVCTPNNLNCAWQVVVTTTEWWIVLSTESGTTTPFPVKVSILAQELGVGTYQGEITLTNPDLSTVVIGVTEIVTAPPPPVINPVQHIVHLTWNASDGAASYNVRRALYPITGSPSYLVLNSLPDASTAYDDNTVDSGSMYLYEVTAVGADGLESAASQAIIVDIPRN